MESFANGFNYWSEEPARKLNLSVVGVMTKRRNWYPAEEMEQAASIVRAIEHHKYIITYGFSQGGYGAIKYSKILCATHVLAFSPQLSIDPNDVAKFDERFCSFFNADFNKNMAITTNDVAGIVRIFVDPADRRDFENSSRITELVKDCVAIPCFNIGHGTVRAVASTGALAELLSACKEGDLNPTRLKTLIRRHKKNTFAYLFALGQKAIRLSHLTLAGALYERAAKLNAKHPLLQDWCAALDERRAEA
jgi:hypothetical protein